MHDDACAKLKGAKSSYKNDVNCVTGYTFPSTTLDPLNFDKKSRYDALTRLMENNGDYVFIDCRWMGGDLQYVAVKKDSIGGLVCPSLDGALAGYMYDTNWEGAIGYNVGIDSTGVACLAVRYVYGNAWHTEWLPINGSLDAMIQEYLAMDSWTSAEHGWQVDFTFADGGGHAGVHRINFGSTPVRLASNLVKDYGNTNSYVYYKSCVGIECYKTFNDLKRGTNFAVLGGYLPQYANEPKQVVTPDDINKKPTKPFNTPTSDDDNGDDNGNDNNNNNNNDDSGSGGFWDSLGDGIVGLFKGIGKLLGRAIEGILELFDQLLSAIADVISYLDEDIAKFFKDVLSFMPEPWVKTITLGLSLVIIGFVITLLRGGK